MKLCSEKQDDEVREVTIEASEDLLKEIRNG